METITVITDKIPLGFMDVYTPIARELGPAANVCELGVAYGGSLELWQHIFTEGTIAGVDNYPDAIWAEGTIKIVCDQADPGLPGILSKHKAKWDLIIDDASHQADLTTASLNNLWSLVRPGGYYCIENIDQNTGIKEFAANLINRIWWSSNTEMVAYYVGLVVLKKRNIMSPVN